jgi:hypothetical protein
VHPLAFLLPRDQQVVRLLHLATADITAGPPPGIVTLSLTDRESGESRAAVGLYLARSPRPRTENGRLVGNQPRTYVPIRVNVTMPLWRLAWRIPGLATVWNCSQDTHFHPRWCAADHE